MHASVPSISTVPTLVAARRPSQQANVHTAQAAVDALRQAATNAADAIEIEAARQSVLETLNIVGIDDAVRERIQRPPVGRNDVCHQVLPRLWLGGCVALNNGCEELRRRGVTHIVSVLSVDPRRVPEFIRGRLHIRVDDKEEAAEDLSLHFPDICRFVDSARKDPSGCVFVHCGAGISRAPTAAACYIMWKLRIPAAAALKIVRSARKCTRPNIGFVRQLKNWEDRMKTLSGCGCGDNVLGV